ncbi:unnamed protein product [Aspergillus oryzae]|nr:unnamed protein product [Aspergillus oryzae]
MEMDISVSTFVDILPEISGTMGYDPDQDINNAEPLNITSNLPSNRKRGRTKKRLIFTSTDREKEVKFMFSNAPFEIVDTLPDKLKEAVQASSLWREERNQRRSTTGCLASLFPRDAEQDVSFTIWCGHDQGYDLNNFFQLKRTSDP